MVAEGVLQGRRRRRGGQELPQGRRQGRAQGHDQDGHLDAAELPRRADLRGDRARPRGRSTATSPGRASRIEGVGLDVIAREAQLRHDHAYKVSPALDGDLDVGGQYQWRRRGEHHMYNPNTVAKLQHAVRAGQLQDVQGVHGARRTTRAGGCAPSAACSRFKPGTPIPLDEVEPAAEIVKRFKTGAMSLGSISREAHENLAIAMNRLGGKSNTGEGGEDPVRYQPRRRTATRGAARSSRWPRAASASPATTSSTPTSCRSRWRRARSPARAASSPATRSTSTSPRSATRRRAWA